MRNERRRKDYVNEMNVVALADGTVKVSVVLDVLGRYELDTKYDMIRTFHDVDDALVFIREHADCGRKEHAERDAKRKEE